MGYDEYQGFHRMKRLIYRAGLGRGGGGGGGSGEGSV